MENPEHLAALNPDVLWRTDGCGRGRRVTAPYADLTDQPGVGQGEVRLTRNALPAILTASRTRRSAEGTIGDHPDTATTTWPVFSPQVQRLAQHETTL